MAIKDVSEKSITELIDLSGRVAIVTGAARGIGRQSAARLAEAGALVALADLDGDLAEQAAREISDQFGTRCVGVAVNVADEASVAALFDTVDAALGRVGILVNNAGLSPPGSSIVDTPAERWDQILAVNLRGAFLCARAAAARMRIEQAGGVIVNIASTAGFLGTIGLSAYVASKHGVVGLTKSLALELAPDNIRVLAVAPTATLTKMLTEYANADKLQASLSHQVALGRIGVPDDVARVVLFGASDLAMFVTGSTIAADAGHLAGSAGKAVFTEKSASPGK